MRESFGPHSHASGANGLGLGSQAAAIPSYTQPILTYTGLYPAYTGLYLAVLGCAYAILGLYWGYMGDSKQLVSFLSLQFTLILVLNQTLQYNPLPCRLQNNVQRAWARYI